MSLAVQPGHIGGTSARDLPGGAENCRDLVRTSSGISAASVEVRRTQEQDPAYRPTHPPALAYLPLPAGILIAMSRYLFPAYGHPQGIGGLAWFMIAGNEVYPSDGHPQGASGNAWFVLEGKYLFPAYGHPQGIGGPAWFTIVGNEVYPSDGHPQGASGNAWYYIGLLSDRTLPGATKQTMTLANAYVRLNSLDE